MHDLHESQPLLYTYSGGAPQNPNLDPILFSELPWFSNFEMAQMTKWGMPGVYTHAFMDGWSPGYLGSVAYNHNAMMRMYETQSGRESGPGTTAGRGATDAARRRAAKDAVRPAAEGAVTAAAVTDAAQRAVRSRLPTQATRPAQEADAAQPRRRRPAAAAANRVSGIAVFQFRQA